MSEDKKMDKSEHMGAMHNHIHHHHETHTHYHGNEGKAGDGGKSSKDGKKKSMSERMYGSKETNVSGEDYEG